MKTMVTVAVTTPQVTCYQLAETTLAKWTEGRPSYPPRTCSSAHAWNGPHILEQRIARTTRGYLNVIEIEFLEFGIVVFQLLQAGINVGGVRPFLLVHLEVGILGNALSRLHAVDASYSITISSIVAWEHSDHRLTKITLWHRTLPYWRAQTITLLNQYFRMAKQNS